VVRVAVQQERRPISSFHHHKSFQLSCATAISGKQDVGRQALSAGNNTAAASMDSSQQQSSGSMLGIWQQLRLPKSTLPLPQSSRCGCPNQHCQRCSSRCNQATETSCNIMSMDIRDGNTEVEDALQQRLSSSSRLRSAHKLSYPNKTRLSLA
jgi:hypothetical protein